MIDERRIEEAARLDDKEYYDRLSDNDRCFFEYGFRRGYNRALKDLWHPASEEPERMKEIIAYGFYATTIVKWCPNGYITWKDYYEKWHYIQWLYIEDLLPKEGGEQ